MKKQSISRRRFLQATGTIALANGFNPYTFAIPKKKKIGVALVGLGYYSRDLLAPALTLAQHCELRGIVTGTPSKIPVWQKRYAIPDSNVYNYDTMHQVANNPDIDVLYIVVPTALHKKYSVIAANAGKHVWCEKPMAMTEQECTDIINVCNKNKVQLAIGYRLQHEPNTRTIIGYARSKPYGSIRSIVAKAGYAGGAPTPDDWRLKRQMGGGALYDMGVYPINAARFTSGEEPIAVTARLDVTRKEVFREVDESAYLTLEFSSGLSATCAASVGKKFNLLHADCEKGWYELAPMQSYTGVKGKTSDGTLLNKTIVNQQTSQMDDDALAILNNKAVIVPGEEGLRDIRIVEAALRSATQGKRITL